jgi:leucyl/phenylalanyl-tRNA--protein transferase
MTLRPFWLDAAMAPDDFPDPSVALREPNGLLAVGGDLSPARLESAYRRGIFPWYSAGQPILWWSPDPRTVLFPEHIRISRSLAKTMRRGVFDVTLDSAFDEVVSGCAAPRPDQPDTWISDDMRAAYARLHRMGIAHSIECWHGGQLAGGLYGVSIGRVFCGESMFSRISDASKVALVTLARMDYELIDCQLETAHLRSMGAVNISRAEFLSLLRRFGEARPAQGFAGSTERYA